MKNTQTNGILIAICIIIGVAVVGAIWWIMDDVFFTVTSDDLRSGIVATSYTMAMLGFTLAIFRADDRRTFSLSIGLALAYLVIGIATFIGNLYYKSASGILGDVAEPIRWAIPFTWVIPVITGALFYLQHTLDVYWGVDKQPLSGGGTSQVVGIGYSFFYNLTIAFALIGSAFGTYAVSHVLTGSFWHSAFYVLTVELAILGFSIFSHSTKDRLVFWWSFGITLAYFGIAVIFQMVDAFMQLGGGINQIEDKYTQFLAQNFVPIAPLITGAVGAALLVYNQRKSHEPLAKHGGLSVERTGRPDRPQFQPRPSRDIVMEREETDRPARQERLEREERPARPQLSPQTKNQGQSQGKREYAEPGGLERETVAALKTLGYSNRAIAGMRQAEADNRIKGKVPPAPNQRSGNYNPSGASQVKKTELSDKSEQRVESARNDIFDEDKRLSDEDNLRERLTHEIEVGRPSRNGDGEAHQTNPH